MFRKCPSLGSKLTASEYKPKQKTAICTRGISKCGQCSYCPWVLEGTTFKLPNGETFKPTFQATCTTKGVIYLMLCNCGAFYVGKTIREFKKRMYDHIYYSQYAKMITPVSRHLGLYHRFDVSQVKFIVLDVIPEDPRGRNWDQRILQKETFWIERLGATSFPGINEMHSYKCFL